jgi:hypothetical protein
MIKKKLLDGLLEENNYQNRKIAVRLPNITNSSTERSLKNDFIGVY